MRGDRIPLGFDAHVHEAVVAVIARLTELEPVHAGSDPRLLFSRVVTPETHPDYGSFVNRAVFAILGAAARGAADDVDPTTGGEAA